MSDKNNNEPVSENDKSGAGGGDLSAKITAQGDLVRQLKGDKKPKEEIDSAVKTLLALKVKTAHFQSLKMAFQCLVKFQADFKTATGSDWKPAGGAPAKKEKEKKPAKEKVEI